MGREFNLIINSLIKWGIFFGILYLIFTNFGTFLIIIFVVISIVYYMINKFKKRMRQGGANNFKFDFNAHDFSKAGSANNFNFNDFQDQFKNGQYQGTPRFSEIQEAKDFFNFTSDPNKDEIKKRYKELARKYHPDINDHDDTLMKKLNHYKDILLKSLT